MTTDTLEKKETLVGVREKMGPVVEGYLSNNDE